LCYVKRRTRACGMFAACWVLLASVGIRCCGSDLQTAALLASDDECRSLGSAECALVALQLRPTVRSLLAHEMSHEGLLAHELSHEGNERLGKSEGSPSKGPVESVADEFNDLVMPVDDAGDGKAEKPVAKKEEVNATESLVKNATEPIDEKVDGKDGDDKDEKEDGDDKDEKK
ncbi:unnamed protein product, partial [Polarella glacialis]